jgi:hypothetical protein
MNEPIALSARLLLCDDITASCPIDAAMRGLEPDSGPKDVTTARQMAIGSGLDSRFVDTDA